MNLNKEFESVLFGAPCKLVRKSSKKSKITSLSIENKNIYNLHFNYLKSSIVQSWSSWVSLHFRVKTQTLFHPCFIDVCFCPDKTTPLIIAIPARIKKYSSIVNHACARVMSLSISITRVVKPISERKKRKKEKRVSIYTRSSRYTITKA